MQGDQCRINDSRFSKRLVYNNYWEDNKIENGNFILNFSHFLIYNKLLFYAK